MPGDGGFTGRRESSKLEEIHQPGIYIKEAVQDWRKHRAMTASRKSHNPDSTFSQRVPSASNTRRSAAVEMECAGGGGGVLLHSGSKQAKRGHKQGGLSGSMTNEVARL